MSNLLQMVFILHPKVEVYDKLTERLDTAIKSRDKEAINDLLLKIDAAQESKTFSTVFFPGCYYRYGWV